MTMCVIKLLNFTAIILLQLVYHEKTYQKKKTCL